MFSSARVSFARSYKNLFPSLNAQSGCSLTFIYGYPVPYGCKIRKTIHGKRKNSQWTGSWMVFAFVSMHIKNEKSCARIGIHKVLERAMKPCEMADERLLIQNYFHLGYENEVILQFLVDYHGIKMSVSTLKRRLRDYGLKRRENEVDVDQVRDIIRSEISGSGQALGCRAVWHSLRLIHRIHVPRPLVATILREIDPVGVQQRRRRRLSWRKYFSYGPNFCWHVDGNFLPCVGGHSTPALLLFSQLHRKYERNVI